MESILLPSEIELYIDTMMPQKMENIGSQQWFDWHQRIQKLNQQALIEASVLKEEQVKETLVSFGKLNVLTHEAILINIWKHKVLPHILKLQPYPDSTFIVYSILYHEAVCVALLELVLYHPNCCEALEDTSGDLLEYVTGNVSQLLSVKLTEPNNQEAPVDEINRQKNSLTFDIGIRSLSIVRYIAENLEGLPLNVRSKMYADYDVPVLFTEIMLAAPWAKNGKVYSGGSWKAWDNEQLGQSEAQVWLTLRHLLLDPDCPKYYPLTESRRNHLAKLLPLMKPTLLDQLSPLIELNHWLCRVNFLDQSAAPPKPLLIEALLEIKEKILRQTGGKWKKLAEKQLPVVFTTDKTLLFDIASKLSDAYNAELLEKFEVKSQAKCAQCGKEAIQRCGRCQKAWYCNRICQTDHWGEHKKQCCL
ncbi:zinc finger MYND domain-containing protein 10 [Leptinotarsa decemlineata]|uniref:zinc finger MYND domain-containing protein 10 n=1 Tax=Leptinotarsa decemlineata TaxID=7539 RepID=UPI000C25343B|nr:zinc finger MYND domain-containing protein 10 [Leptinotarsa decemlineata]